MKRFFLAALAFAASTQILSACSENSASENADFDRILAETEKTAPENKSECMIAYAKAMLGTAYVEGTLETEPEELIIDFQKTDCILFVESALAFSQTYFSENRNFETYRDMILSLRYRNGELAGYTSRIHYTTEWLIQAAGNGFVELVSEQICKEAGIPRYNGRISFMSEHPDSYPALRSHPERVEKIRQIEEALSRQTCYVIPKDRIEEFEKSIQDGDIIAFNTNIEGLDISHVAIAYRDNGRLTFIHASSAQKKVVIERKSLKEYCASSRICDGIRVARVK